MEIFQTFGETPFPRFGHTVNIISNTKVILFGGATGDVGKYSITGDTFLLEPRSGASWSLQAVPQLSGQPMPQRQSIACSWSFTEALWAEVEINSFFKFIFAKALSLQMTYTSWICVSARRRPPGSRYRW